jgi:hypothetical protein
VEFVRWDGGLSDECDARDQGGEIAEVVGGESRGGAERSSMGCGLGEDWADLVVLTHRLPTAEHNTATICERIPDP